MSQKYSGGFITKSPVAPTSSAASGIWTLDQQMQAQKAGTWPSPPIFIEDLFSTYLYTGTGAAQTITNSIDISTKGGAVWIKGRNQSEPHVLVDSARGAANALRPNSTAASINDAGRVSAFTTSGFSVGTDGETNGSATTYASWTFRKQPKFFDIVTWTGDGTNRAIPHNLGSVPGCMIVKCTNAAYGWMVYHRSTGATKFLYLDTTDAAITNSTAWNDTEPTSTVFTVGNAPLGNESGKTYVAYLFAHDAGGFPVSGGGSTNGISCGSYVGNGTDGLAVTLGYEPQFVIIKKTSSAGGGWLIQDVMRGMSNTGSVALSAQTGNAEADYGLSTIIPTATGFTLPLYGGWNGSGETFIYIAIRRGPMKVPTSGTSVFGLSARTGTGADATVTGSAGVSDAVLVKNRGSAVESLFSSRLTGTGYLVTSTTAVEVAAGATILQANPWDVMDGVKIGTTSTITNASGNTYINYLFRRAPSFFDVVCYTGTGVARTVEHNLTVAPELIIIKTRVGLNTGWITYCAYLPAPLDDRIILSTDAAKATSVGTWKIPTTTTWGMDISFSAMNQAGYLYVSYLFATCPGVSKVGSYTGNGTTQTIDCGFTGGARFVLIKRTDAIGDWYVYDTARGMTAMTDPYLWTNSANAEVATLGSVTTVSTGFALDSAILAAINVNAGSYIFLAIA